LQEKVRGLGRTSALGIKARPIEIQIQEAISHEWGSPNFPEGEYGEFTNAL
jgi:hypothetical protein